MMKIYGILKKLSCLTFLFFSVNAFAFEHFITREGSELRDGEKTFRFVGFNAPELHRIEQDARGKCKADRRPWGQYFKWPTALEQENWIKALTQSGHKATRIYVLSIAHPDDAACGRETHVLPPATKDGPPRLNETAMVHYDRMIKLSGDYGLRLILPFVDHWNWWGGRKELAAFYGEHEDDFYRTSSKTFKAYLSIIEQVLNRTNTLTGRKYIDEKAILAWETGNELKATTKEFLAKTAAFIKSIDQNHLLIDGTYLKINNFALDDPNIDIISNHFYTENHNNNPEQVISDLKAIKGKKVYLLGEFGLISSPKMQKIIDVAVNTELYGSKTAGAMIWGFRGHRQEGGHYFHREKTGHYSYHLPGSRANDSNEELAVIDIIRRAQAKLDGRTEVAPLPVPEAPILHDIRSVNDIRWMGSPTGRQYRVERSDSLTNKWQVVGDKIDIGRNEFNPKTGSLFADTQKLENGKKYFYRVVAINESGESKPSNVVSFSVNDQYVTTKGGQFYLDGKPYYFIGANYWYGTLLGSTEKGRERLRKELDHMLSVGINNLRVLVGAEGGELFNQVNPALQPTQGQYNEALLKGLDWLLVEMNKRQMKAVLYLTNNWIWSGGKAQYLKWNGFGDIPNPFMEEHSWDDYIRYTSQFVRCKPCKNAFYSHVKKIVSRVNSVSKRPYNEDPAIMSWQIANEPRVFVKANYQHFMDWINTTVGLIKGLDNRHLISTGSEGAAGSLNDPAVFKALHENKDIDYLTMHVWPKNWSWYDVKDEKASSKVAIKKAEAYLATHIGIAEKLNKPIVLSEFGFPRRGESLSPSSDVEYRDLFFKFVFNKVVEHQKRDGHFAGVNFWSYAGFGQAKGASWVIGSDYLGDPPQEPQGLNSVFSSDYSTMALINRFNDKIQRFLIDSSSLSRK